MVYSDQNPEPLKITIWTGDFMGMGKHNMPCPVCMDNPAILERNCSINNFSQKFAPCKKCQDEGWRLKKITWLDRYIYAFKRFIGIL